MLARIRAGFNQNAPGYRTLCGVWSAKIVQRPLFVPLYSCGQVYQPSNLSRDHRTPPGNATAGPSHISPCLVGPVSIRSYHHQRHSDVTTTKNRKSFRHYLLWALCRRQKIQLLCYQANPSSFCKTPGVGGYCAFRSFGINNIQTLFLSAVVFPAMREPRSYLNHQSNRRFGVTSIIAASPSSKPAFDS